jgi:hypothetical protein
MASRARATRSSSKLTLENLESLGAARLARLVLNQAETDPIFARAARMEMAARDDSGALAHEIGKRLKTIRRSRSFIEWDKVRPLAQDLDQLRAGIAGPLAETSPREAIELMRLFLSLAEPVFERADDSSGALGDVFRQGGEDLGKLWCRVGVPEPNILAGDILTLIESDGYGVFDGLPEAASPALGKAGRAALRHMLLERQASLPDAERRRFDYTAGWLLPKLADLDDDVDAYIATVDPDRRNALLNAKVAERLIAHGRCEEALGWIEAPTERGHNERELADLKLQALCAMGRREDAQAQRKAIFDRWLDSQALRDWLKNLPDFEDFDAEQQALDQAMAFDPGVPALAFLVEWPDLKRAGQLVRARIDQLDGRVYDILRPCAEALSSSDPVGATLLYRQLVTGVLDRGASKYYAYAVRDFVAAGKLADGIDAGADIMRHVDWIDLLRRSHGRKIGFWSQIPT